MRRAALILMAAVTLLSIDYRMLVQVAADRANLRDALRRRAERVPGFHEFLEGVRARTANGDTIALIVGARDPKTYGYGQIRATYILAGRTVVPMMGQDGRFRPAAVRQAQYLAVFRMEYRGAGRVVWRGDGGVLVRQR